MTAISEPAEHLPSTSQAQRSFWVKMSEELFENVYNLYEQIDAYLPLRSREEGLPPIIIFCAYICGSLASSLWKAPQRKDSFIFIRIKSSANEGNSVHETCEICREDIRALSGSAHRNPGCLANGFEMARSVAKTCSTNQ